MGVRAVVAAGWAVDDDAAALFARTFYERMLSGVPFGRAVHQARAEVYRRFPRSNTWGAYQCYGDPDWKLVRDAGDAPSEQEVELFASPMQAAIARPPPTHNPSINAMTGWRHARIAANAG